MPKLLEPILACIYSRMFYFAFLFLVQAGVFYSSFASHDLSKEISLKGDKFCASFFVSAQSSEMYRKIDAIRALNILRRIDSELFGACVETAPTQ